MKMLRLFSGVTEQGWNQEFVHQRDSACLEDKARLIWCGPVLRRDSEY